MATYTISGLKNGAYYEFQFEIDWSTGDATLTAIEGYGSLNGLFFDYTDGGDTQLTLDGGVNLNGLKIYWDSGTLLDDPGTPFPYGVASDGTTNGWDTSVSFDLYDPANGFYLLLADGTTASIELLQTLGSSLDEIGFRFTTSTGGSIKDTGDLEETPALVVDKYVYEIDDNGADCEDNSGTNPEDPTVDSANDVITYRVGVLNTGETDLTDVKITDAFLQFAEDINFNDEDGTQIRADLDGDGNFGDILTVQSDGEDFYVYIGDLAEGSNAVYIQYSVDAGEVFTDPGFGGECPADEKLGVITNIAIAASAETDPEQDDADVAVTCCEPELQLTPNIAVDKVVSAIVDTDDYCDDHSATNPESPTVDSEGDLITYTVTVTNIGNVTLQSSYIQDAMLEFALDADGDSGNGKQVKVVVTQPDGSTSEFYANVFSETDGFDTFWKVSLPQLDDDGLDIDDPAKVYATAVISYVVAATEAEILDGSDIDNTVYAQGTAEILGELVDTDLVDDSASVYVDQCPDLELLKTAAVADGTADKAGDIITYTLTLSNIGNTNLSNILVTDAMFANAELGSIKFDGTSISLNPDGTLSIAALAFGSSGEITFDYALTQADIDNSVEYVYDPEEGSDCPEPIGLLNAATADVDGDYNTANNSAEVTTDIVYNPDIDLDKSVNKTYATKAGDVLTYTLVITNEGNVTLTGIKIEDTYFKSGVVVSVSGGSSSTLTGNYYTIAELGVGQSTTLTYQYTVTSTDVSTVYGSMNGVDFLKNTATATAAECSLDPYCQRVSDTDSEAVDLLIGPGVRTPGFWLRWTAAWDGNKLNDYTFNTKANFPGQDVLWGARSGSHTDLLIGDWNANNVIDSDENGFRWSLTTAKTVLGASTKLQQDTRYVLGRDVVADWLNYLAGNSVCKDDLQAGINWLKTKGAINSTTTTPFSGAAVSASSTAWTTPVIGGNAIHNEIDAFNNTGFCDGVQLALYGGSSY